MVECKHGMGGKNAPICYIPEQDLVQDALEKTKKTTYFKLTLQNTGNKLKVAIRAALATTGTARRAVRVREGAVTLRVTEAPDAHSIGPPHRAQPANNEC